MANYNRKTPGIQGADWYGSRQRAIAVSAGVAGGPLLTAEHTESIASLAMLTRTPLGPQPVCMCDVYDLANPLADGEQMVMMRPTANASNWAAVSGGWDMRGSDAGISPYADNAYQHLDEIVYAHYALSPSDPANTWASQVRYAAVATRTPYAARIEFVHADGTDNAKFDGNDGSALAATVLNGKRIKSVEVVATLQNDTPAAIGIDAILTLGGVRVSSTDGPYSLPIFAGITRVVWRFNANAVSGGLPWSQAAIAGLLAGTDLFGIGITSKPAAGLLHVGSIVLQIRVCNERRLATSIGYGGPGVDTWSGFPLVSPADFMTPLAWSKVTGHQYAMLVSAFRAPISLLGVDSGATDGGTNLIDHGLATVSLDPLSVLCPSGALVPDNLPAMNVTMGITGGGISADSVPYAVVNALRCGADGASPLTQGLPSGTGSYGIAGILVASDGQDAPLTVELKTGATVLGTGTIEPGDVPMDGLYHLLWVQLDNAAALDGGQTLSCRSTSTRGWLLPCLFGVGVGMDPADAQGATAAVAGIGGTADTANEGATSDFPWSIGTVPAAPTGLTGNEQNFTTTNKSPGGPARIGYAALDWTSTTLGAAFGFYELQRDGVAIAWITSEASSYFNDFESARNTDAVYRVRVVRNDGARSALSGSATVQVHTALDCDNVLTSNWFPDLTVAYQDEAPHSYGRANASTINPQLIAGRRYPVVVRPLTEGDSDVFSRIYNVAQDTLTTPLTVIDRRNFDPIVAIVEAPAPYVALLQGNGDRWLVAGRIDANAMVMSQPGNSHKATVGWTEVDGGSAILETATPWAP